MARLMTAARLGVVVLLAVAILGAVGTFSFKDVSAAGRAGAAKVPALFKDNGNKGGNNGHGGGNGNGHGNGNGGVTTDQSGGQDGDTDQGNGHGKKHKKAKKDKANKQADDSASPSDDEGDDAGSGKAKNPKSGNVDCSDVEGMIEYLKNRNMNGALHANENGADNAAAGALNKCMNHGPENGDNADSGTEDGTPVAEDATPEVEDGTPVAESGTPIAEDNQDSSDKPVSVKVDIDENGNGTIEYDLDGDGETDLTMIVKDGKVTDYVEANAADATPEVTADTETA